MRLLLIGISCVALFFPLYWALHPFAGPNWGAGIAAFMMYIGFPSLFLLKWHRRSTHPLIKACNYALAVVVLLLLAWVAYRVIVGSAPLPQAVGLFFVYGGLAVYFLKHGYMPYQAEEMEAQEND
ncbi:hypothetical protein JN531_013065 [Flagellatimonas centrodinii]|uniref:hypothetical protein n=1 Tax=Flagellatimonas centrodinii TaxID=2806210 RepID=UPI001FEF7F4E|nr:hypothetical protein [Flagellatimonas centrodinii]ULQ46027.1 hypothetical protein JN531_013065 [Flagellatimonas centrodinii]